MTERLRIAIQKKGRLFDDSKALLEKCGLRFSIRGDGLLTRVKNMPIDLLLVRDDDIPGFVASGVAQLGIVGENVLKEEELTSEKGLNAKIDIKLGFSRCRICLASGEDSKIKKLTDLTGQKVATSYPGILKDYLRSKGQDAECVEMKGAVELAPRVGIAEAICDLVSSGATLEANGLAVFDTIFESEAVLIKSDAEMNPVQAEVYERLVNRIAGVIRSKDSKYIMLNAPASELDNITKMLPGNVAPTIIPLAGRDDMVAIHAVCTENVFWETLEELEAHGAQAILVLPIEKMLN